MQHPARQWDENGRRADKKMPEPGVICLDIIADLESALEQLKLIAEDVGESEE